MTEQEIYDLYVLQSKNVRHLKQVKDNLVKDVNKELKKLDNNFNIELKTKLLALLYCTISEAQFIQIVHTPKGFSYAEIEMIKGKRSIVDGWKLMIDLAMDKVGDWNNVNDLLNRRNELHNIVAIYIEEPQGLRNKIAHGQWVHALNNINTKENPDMTSRMNNLDVVKITIWLEIHQYLAYIIRDLVQSPQKGFHNNYWVNLVNLNDYIANSQSWTIEKRIERIRNKNIKN